jgi:hypothetical protein
MFCWHFDRCPLRAVNRFSLAMEWPLWRALGPSQKKPCRPGIRPIEASKAAIGYVRSTSIRDIEIAAQPQNIK